MDSHVSHITPEILSKTSDNGIHLVTFPSYTTHLLQPLDVGVYRPLNEGDFDFNGLLPSTWCLPVSNSV